MDAATTPIGFRCGLWFSFRTIVSCFLLLCVISYAGLRANLSIAMVCMVNASSHFDEVAFNKSGTVSSQCIPSQEAIYQYHYGKFGWSSWLQGYLYLSHTIGQMIAFMFVGSVSDSVGCHLLIFLSLFAAGVITMFTPMFISYGYLSFLFVRFVIGFCYGLGLPSANKMLMAWIPELEIAGWYGFVVNGRTSGVTAVMFSGAILCQQYSSHDGWPMVYYITGLMAIVWATVHFVINKSAPEFDRCKCISPAERSVIVENRKRPHLKQDLRLFEAPFRNMFSNPAFLVCVLCQFSMAFTMTCLINYLPTYFRDIYFLNLTKNGICSALPFLFPIFTKSLFNRAYEFLVKGKHIEGFCAVKIFNTIGFFGMAISLLAFSALPCDLYYIATLCLCIANICQTATYSGYLISQLQIAPSHMAYVTWFTNLAACLGQITVTVLVSEVVANGTVFEWHIVFFGISCLLIVSGSLFLIYGTVDVQRWARKPRSGSPNVDKIMLGRSPRRSTPYNPLAIKSERTLSVDEPSTSTTPQPAFDSAESKHTQLTENYDEDSKPSVSSKHVEITYVQIETLPHCILKKTHEEHAVDPTKQMVSLSHVIHPDQPSTSMAASSSLPVKKLPLASIRRVRIKTPRQVLPVDENLSYDAFMTEEEACILAETIRANQKTNPKYPFRSLFDINLSNCFLYDTSF